MQDPVFGFGGFNQGESGGGQTHVIRRTYVSNDSPTQLSTPDPFLTSRFQAMLPTMKPSMTRLFDDDDDDDSPPSPPSKPDSSMITHRYYTDGFPAPFPPKVEPPKAPRYDEYYKPPPKAKAPRRYDDYYKPPPRTNPPMIYGGYYGNGLYPPRQSGGGYLLRH